MLTLSEKLLLLGYHDQKGKVVASASMALPYGLAGALLMELYIFKRIVFVDNKVHVSDPTNTKMPLMDEVLALISASNTSRDAKYWLNKIHSKVKDIEPRIAEQLVQKGILAKTEHHFMWVINFNRYPTLDALPEQDVRSHVKDVVLRGAQTNEEDIALLSLIQACELTNEIFEKGERKDAKNRIAELVNGEKISQAITQMVQEIETALVILITTTAVTTTVVS